MSDDFAAADFVQQPEIYFALYDGTCAQYTTVRRDKAFLENLGCRVRE